MNIIEMMKKAQSLQSDMEELKKEMDAQHFNGESGAGAVVVSMSGDGKVQQVTIDPSIDERTVIQDLVCAAFNQANANRREYRAKKMQDMTAGLPVPPGMMGL